MFIEKLLESSIWNAGFIGIVFCTRRLLRNKLSPQINYHFWYIVAFSLLIFLIPIRWTLDFNPLPISGSRAFSIPYELPINNGNPIIISDAAEDTVQLMYESNNIPLERIFQTIWIVGFIITGSASLYCVTRLMSLKRFAVRPECRILTLLEKNVSIVGCKKKVILLQSSRIYSPISFGVFSPTILLPDDIDQLSDDEIEHILLHELVHICHNDSLGNYLFCILQSLYWFHPLTWLSTCQMRRDREIYCDWTVLCLLQSETERIKYGRTLLNFASRKSHRLALANGLNQNKSELKSRLENICSFRPNTYLSSLIGRSVAICLIAASLFQIPVYAFCSAESEEYYNPQCPIYVQEVDWSEIYGNRNGCAIIYDIQADTYIAFNASEMTRRVSPCSTYKIYSALNALEMETISPTNNTLVWDGSPNYYESWNQNHDLKSAMHYSVNWYFQRLDQLSGKENTEGFFQKIHYGTGSLGDDPDGFWNGSGIRISALEQVELLTKLYHRELPAQPNNVDAVLAAMLTNSEDSVRLYAKTGTGRLGNQNVSGWYIGIVEKANCAYTFAFYIYSEEGTSGNEAANIAKTAFSQMGVVL